MCSCAGRPSRLLLVTMFLVSCVDVQTADARRRTSRPDYCDPETRQSSFLWRINTSPPSFFFGTIHVPYDRVWNHVPENVKRAFHLSDAIFFELQLTEPATVAALIRCQLLPRGVRLEHLLPRDIYRRLQNHLDYVRRQMPRWLTEAQRGRGLSAEHIFNAITSNWQQKRPVWVMLMVNSLTEGDVRARGVPVLDLYLAMQAERMEKRTGAVERVQEQCLPLNRLQTEQVVSALNRTLTQQERSRAGQPPPAFTTEDLIKHYNCGDLDEVIFRRDSSQIPPSVLQVAPLQPSLSAPVATDTDIDSDPGQDIDRYFRHELIYKRNRRMGERIVDLLLSHPHTSFFFAFGAGHFLGNFTVIDVLRQAGYKVTRVGPSERIQRFNRRKHPAKSEPDFSEFPPGGGAVLSGVPAEPGDASDIFPSSGAAIFKTARGSTTPSKKYLDNFSDLWIRIDDNAKREPSAGDPSPPPGAEDSVRRRLGLPAERGVGSGDRGLAPSAALLAVLLLLVMALSPPRIELPGSVFVLV